MLIEKEIADTVSVNGYNRKARDRMNKQIKLVANSNTEILITMPENKIQDFVIKLAKYYTDKYEPAEITICDIKEQTNEK